MSARWTVMDSLGNNFRPAVLLCFLFQILLANSGFKPALPSDCYFKNILCLCWWLRGAEVNLPITCSTTEETAVQTRYASTPTPHSVSTDSSSLLLSWTQLSHSNIQSYYGAASRSEIMAVAWVSEVFWTLSWYCITWISWKIMIMPLIHLFIIIH